MSDDDKAAEAETTIQPATGQAAPEGADGGAAEAAQARIEALEAENADIRDRLLRTVAEMENLRKRTEREVRDASQYAVSGFARDMLAVGDNMRRALEAVSPEARETAEAAMKSLLEGVEMTERELLKALERHGVRQLDPAGERFDPNLHQAMFEVPDESVPSGTVVQVMQSGFTIGERVLRPAMVGVSKGGPRPGAKAAESADGGDAADGPKIDRTA